MEAELFLRNGEEGALAQPAGDVGELFFAALERVDQMLFGAVGTQCGRSTFRPLARFLDVQHRDVDLGEVLLVQLLQPPLSLHPRRRRG